MRHELPIAIVDIDGTLADLTHRLHHITGEKKDWIAFHGELADDEPIKPVIELVNNLYENYQIYLCTGRMQYTRDTTAKWLFDNNVCYDRLLMRINNDHRLDTIVKPEMFAPSELKRCVLAIDDRARTIQMWRDLGLIGLLCSEGAF